jgi:hypothetical protein
MVVLETLARLPFSYMTRLFATENLLHSVVVETVDYVFP